MADAIRVRCVAGRYEHGRGTLLFVNDAGLAMVRLDDYPGVLKIVRFTDLTDETEA